MTEYLTRGLYAFIISVLMMSVAISCDSEDADMGNMEGTEQMGHDDDTVPKANFMTPLQPGTITIMGGPDSLTKVDLSSDTVYGYVASYPPNDTLDSLVSFLIIKVPGPITYSNASFPQPGITDQPVALERLEDDDDLD